MFQITGNNVISKLFAMVLSVVGNIFNYPSSISRIQITQHDTPMTYAQNCKNNYMS